MLCKLYHQPITTPAIISSGTEWSWSVRKQSTNFPKTHSLLQAGPLALSPHCSICRHMTFSDISVLHDRGELCNCSEAFIMSDRQMASRAAEINLYKSKSFHTMWSQQETGFHWHPVITYLNLSELTNKFEAKVQSQHECEPSALHWQHMAGQMCSSLP